MPTKFLNCGAAVLVDADDWELLEGVSWYIYRLRPSNKLEVVRRQRRFGREFRQHLHREVVLRMRPELIKKRFTCTPLNGDYTDCRRENLAVALQNVGRPGRPKIEPRPQGHRYCDYTGRGGTAQHVGDTSPAWAGGYEYKELNREYKGEGRRVRKCIAGKPVD